MQDDKTPGDKTSGYVADMDYTYGYYTELNPAAARFALLAAGIAPPKFDNACELGFGQGVSIAMHAAASATHWWGNDFLPQQAAFAQGLVRAAGAKADITAESFDDFCARADLPDMDFIGLHGVWTWVNETNRNTIVDFIRRKLKPGGVVYASYNTQPGWSNVIPVRELFLDYADAVGGAGQGTSQRIDTAMAFTEKLLATNPRFLQGNSLGQQQLKHITGQDKHYLAHEFFNRDWEPMSFAKFSKAMEPAGVTFACSANMLENVDALYMTAEQVAFMQSIPDSRVRQSVRDFLLNANFRRDYWVRGAKPLSPDEQRKALEEQHVVLCQPPENVVLKAGDARLSEAVYGAILQAMADFKPKPIREIASKAAARNVTFAQVVQALVILTGKHDVLAAQQPGEATRTSSMNLNRHLIAGARNGKTQVQYLASPVTGGGLFVPTADQVAMAAPGFTGKRADVYRALGLA